VEKLAKVANVEPTLVPRAGATSSRKPAANAMAEPLYFGEYYDVPPITEYMGKVRRLLKTTATPFEAGLKRPTVGTRAITSRAQRGLNSTTSCWAWCGRPRR